MNNIDTKIDKIFSRVVVGFVLLATTALMIFGGWYFLPEGGIAGLFTSNTTDSSKPDPLKTGEREIDFWYTDQNDGEDLLIYSDSQMYEGLNRAEVFFAVKNLSGKSQDVKLQGLLSQNSSRFESMEIWEDGKWEQQNFQKNSRISNSRDIAEAYNRQKKLPDFYTLYPKAATEFEIKKNQTRYFRTQLAFNPGSNGEFIFEAFGTKGAYGQLDPWYQTAWGYRKKLTIDGNQVSGTSDLTNFPLLVKMTDPDLADTGNGGGMASSTAGDLFFTSSDGETKIDHEIEKYTNTTGELVAWVEIPTLKAQSDTTIYMYYGNASATYQPTNEAVWNSSYKGVWHLNETVTDEATSGTHYDSTSNSHDGTQNNNDDTTGQISGGQNFDGASDYINIGNTSDYNYTTQNFSISFWLKPASSGISDNDVIVSRGLFNTDGYYLQYKTDVGQNNLQFVSNQSSANQLVRAGDDVSTGVYHHIVFVRNGTSGKWYIDGQETSVYDVNDSITNPVSSTRNLYLMRYDSTTLEPNSAMDEMRIYSGVHSADWIKTEYNNQRSPETTAAVSGEQTENRTTPTYGSSPSGISVGGNTGSPDYANGWNYRKKITINGNAVSGTSDLTNFPVLINHVDSDLADTANGGGMASSTAGDLLFTQSDGATKIDHEIEKYTNTTGELVAWVEIPTLKAQSDTTIYMYYGNSTVPLANQENPTGTWNSNYKGVWHLNNGDSTVAGFYLDSTGNNNDGTLTDSDGDTVQGTGMIGYAMDFAGDNDYIEIANSATMENYQEGDFTVYAWTSPDNDPPGTGSDNDAKYEIMAKKGFGAGTQYIETTNFRATHWLTGDAYAGVDTVDTFTPATYYQVVQTVSKTDGENRLYIDGNLNNTTSFTPGTNAREYDQTPLRIGIHNPGAATNRWAMDGKIDEVRVLGDTMSADWIKTEYNNQLSPSTFYSISGLGASPSTKTDPNLKFRGGVRFRLLDVLVDILFRKEEE